MKLIRVNPSNAIYYSEDFIKGFECGAKRQLEADERSIPKGHWIEENPSGTFICSECGHKPYNQLTMSNYCPRCGADMRGENDE